MLARYGKLPAAEIIELVVDDKWMASVEGAIGQVVERLTVGLVDRVRVLEGRYAKALPALERRVEGLRGEGRGSPEADGGVGMSRQFDFERHIQVGLERFTCDILAAGRYRHTGSDSLPPINSPNGDWGAQ